MSFLEIARNRQSCRKYDAQRPVEQEKLDAILKAVRLAPSACADTPDTLLIAGTSDYHVLPRHSEKLFDKLTECGANTRLMYSIAGGHGFEPMHYGVEPQPGMPGVQEEIVKFILERV